MLPQRKRLRLEGFDYSTNRYYFITICVITGRLGYIVDDNVKLNRSGALVHHSWVSLSLKYPCVELDEFIIMPDHFHAIIILSNDSGIKPKSLSDIVQAFKLSCIRKIHLEDKSFRWERSFNDRIIRNEKELHNIRYYIKYNAIKT
jgi:putative transposase